MGVDGDQSIVGCAASQSTGTRVQSALHFTPGRWVEASVKTAIGGLVTGLEVASLTLLVRVVLDKEVPCQTGVL
jgi:hypothetical protein